MERRSAELIAAGLVDAVPVPGDPPLDGVVELLAAQSVGAVPVLTGSGFDADVTQDLVRRAGALAAGDPPGTGAAGRLVLLTSGTSGDPRAVVRTTASW